MKVKGLIYAVIILAILFLTGSVYVVDETEQVIVTQFGKAIGEPKQSRGYTSRFRGSKIQIISQKTYLTGMEIQGKYRPWIRPLSGLTHSPGGKL